MISEILKTPYPSYLRACRFFFWAKEVKDVMTDIKINKSLNAQFVKMLFHMLMSLLSQGGKKIEISHERNFLCSIADVT